jgi:N-acetylmuramoyl-L-alanine amidase
LFLYCGNIKIKFSSLHPVFFKYNCNKPKVTRTMSPIQKSAKNILFITAGIFICVLVLAASYYSVFIQKKSISKTVSIIARQQFRLVVDAGHGGNDDGSKYNGIKEKNITLAIAEKIQELAPQYGIDVVMTRTGDKFINPIGRVSMADHQSANAYVSIHVNELRGYQSVSGMQVYVSNQNPQFSQSCVLGSGVAKSLSDDFKVFGQLQDRAKNIYVLSENTLPAVLVECGFITNPTDVKILTDSAEESLIAKQILEGVAAYKNHKVTQMYGVRIPHSADAIRSKNILASYHATIQKKV